jgi:hypothetical protein
MPFGILETKGWSKSLERVSGEKSNRKENLLMIKIACMNDQLDVPREYEQIPRDLLKHATGRYSHVILVPQPSDSPNDPLNWPTWRKDMILLIVGFVTALVGAFGPMLSPGFLIIAADLDIKVSTLGQNTT